MVERPIKKSERQAVTDANNLGAAPEAQPSTNEAGGADQPSPPKSSTTPPLVIKDKKKAKGRERQKDEQSSKPPVNLALMRGPKPTKPKPPVTKAPEAASDDVSDDVSADPEQET